MPRRLPLVLVFVCSLPARAGEPQPAFVLHAADRSFRGTLETVGPDWSVRLGGPEGGRAAGADVVELRRLGRPLPGLEDAGQLLFANGDRLPGVVTRLDGEQVRFRPGVGAGGEMTVPLSALTVLWFAAPDGTARPELLRRRLRAETRTRDVVLLRNGDAVEGILAGLDEKTVRVDAGGKTVEVPRDRVALVALNNELGDLLRPKGPYARLVTAGGARVSLASATCPDGRTLSGRTLFGEPLQVPVAELAALYVHGGRAVYLSDLKPRRYEHTPYLGASWPLAVDASVAGRDLRLGGGTHDKGLGMHSRARVTYDLGGRYRRFEALVGLDDVTGREGGVRVEVLVDGKPRELGGGELTAARGPVPVRADVAGARELTLVVDFGPHGDVQDDVNWADARLIR